MKLRSILAFSVAAALASSAWAQCSGAKAQTADNKQAGCHGATAKLAGIDSCSAKCSDKADCAARCGDKAATCDVAKAKSRSIPVMQYKVGDKVTCCPDEAAKLAGDNKDAIQYVVGEETIAGESDAKQAYAKLLERQLQDVTTVKFAVGDDCVTCPMTAKAMATKAGKPVHYRLASFDFENQDAAQKAAETARQAAEKVAMKMVVGEKEFCCATTAASVAKADGKKVEYCVGDKKTPCNVTASVDLALAKLNAALDVLAQAANG